MFVLGLSIYLRTRCRARMVGIMLTLKQLDRRSGNEQLQQRCQRVGRVTGAWPYHRPCAQQYVGKSQSCMVTSAIKVHSPRTRVTGGGDVAATVGPLQLQLRVADHPHRLGALGGYPPPHSYGRSRQHGCVSISSVMRASTTCR